MLFGMIQSDNGKGDRNYGNDNNLFDSFFIFGGDDSI